MHDDQMTDTQLAAVLFDMDGTLIDSEKVWEVALHALATRYGGVMSASAREQMLGASSERTMAILLDDIGQPWRDPVEGADWLDRAVAELFADRVEWRPGAKELLNAVRAAGLPTALVTNTRRNLVRVALRTIGAENFDVLICGDDVARTKPDPEPYRRAAGRLGLDPAVCVAVEDSPAGAASALAAGCCLLAVPNDVELPDIDALVLPSLAGVDLSILRAAVYRRAGRPRISETARAMAF
jgi:HAD superfamily hydrolase (TIGR01509 family)